MNRFTTMILTSVLAVSAQSALAADPFDDAPRHVDVHFADLDLNRTEGAASLYQRLRLAAETVCTGVSDRDPARAARGKACVSEAIATAVAQINRPILNAYYRSKLGIANAALREASN
jgi:UrcA family protein